VLVVSNVCAGCSFKWSNGSTAKELKTSTSGIYSVVARNHCGQSQPARDTVRMRLYTPKITLNKCTLTAPAGSDYQWFLDDLALLDGNEATYEVLTPGFYAVQMTAPDGCKGTSAPLLATSCGGDRSGGVSDRTANTSLTEEPVVRMFPNPTSGRAYWQVQTAEVVPMTLEIFSVSGALLLRQESPDGPVNDHTFTTEVGALPAAIYLYRVQAGPKTVWGKFVREY
jgi:hypothetical protein